MSNSSQSQSQSQPQPPRRILGFSTKMYFSHAQTMSYISSLLSLITSEDTTNSKSYLQSVDTFIVTDFISLTGAVSQLRDTPVMVGAQDCHSENTGAFTGEISPAMLAEVGCDIVELNHAERRRLFGETDQSTARKAAAAAQNGLIPLICIGEVAKGTVSEAGEACRLQLETVLAEIPENAQVILAYEPVWAIGADEPAEASHVIGVVGKMRELGCVRRRAGKLRILYGGSAGPGTFAGLKDAVDGLFLGRFAHDPEQFWETIREVASA